MKTGVGQLTVGSNPTPSARLHFYFRQIRIVEPLFEVFDTSIMHSKYNGVGGGLGFQGAAQATPFRVIALDTTNP